MSGESPYAELVAELRQQTEADLVAGESHAQETLDRVTESLPRLVKSGQLTRNDIESADGRLVGPHAPRLYAVDFLAELNVRAAQTLGDLEVARRAAKTRAYALSAIAESLTDTQKGSLRGVTRAGLDLDKEWNLAAIAPDAVAGLHFHAARAGGRPDQVVDHLLDAHRLAGEAPLELRDMLITTLRGLGRRLLDQSDQRELAGLDPSMTRMMLDAAIRAFEAVGPPLAYQETAIRGLGFALSHGDLESATKLADELTDQTLGGDQLQRVRLFRAELLTYRGEHLAALKALDALLSDRSFPANGRTIALACRVDNLAALERYVEAVGVAQRLLSLTRRLQRADPDNPGPRAAVLDAARRLGVMRIRSGHSFAGARVFRRAENDIAAWEVGPVASLELAEAWADALYESADYVKALREYRRAASLRRANEQRMPGLNDVVLSMEDGTRTDARIVELLLSVGKPADAMDAAEGAKGRMLARQAQMHSPLGPLLSDEGARDLVEHFMLAARGLSSARRELAEMLPDAAGRWLVEQRVRDLSGDLQRVRALLVERALARAAADSTPSSMARSALFSVLELTMPHIVGRPDEAAQWGAVSFFSGPDGTAVTLEANADFVGRWLPDWPHERLDRELFTPFEAARAARGKRRLDSEGWSTAVDQLRRDAHAALWAPIAEEISRRAIKHLVVLPHRALHSLPWLALEDARGRALLDDLDSLVVVPGANTVATALERFREDEPPWAPEASDGQALVVVRADERAPLIGAEGAMVSRVLDPRAVLVSGPQASAESLYTSAPRAAILHVACHGTWDADDLERSGLVLAPPESELASPFSSATGFASVPDLLGRLLLPTCTFAVASACETGLARSTPGDEPIGIPTALIICGARRVVASHWRVRDDSALLLMSFLYRANAEQERVAVRLARAQRQLRSLSAKEAIEELEAIRPHLATGILTGPERQSADEALTLRIRALTELDADARPYSTADHWGAFSCFGAP